MTTISMDKLCFVYLKIRDKKTEITKAYDTQLEELETQLKEVASEMKERLQAEGGTSLKTEHGTIYLKTATRYFAQDWAAFGEWVVANKAVDLYEKRVAQGNMNKWLEEFPQNPPPGLQANSELTVSVRKA